jgi:cellulose synthase operon protein B
MREHSRFVNALRYFVGLVVCIGVFATPDLSRAQSEQPTPTPISKPQPTPTSLRNTQVQITPTTTAQDSLDRVTLARLGRGEIALQGPFDTQDVSFSLPATWKLTEQATAELDISVFVTSRGAATTTGFGGLLSILIDDQTVGSVNIDRVGDRSVKLNIPLAVLQNAVATDNRINLAFKLDAGFSCDFDQQTNVIIRTTSGLNLPHTIAKPPTDLALLPRPIFQRSFEIDSAVLIVADNPSAADLQAALTVMAGMGQATSGRLPIQVTTAGLLNETQRTHNHLIYVGRSSAFSQLNTITFPAKVGGSTITIGGMSADDGILQMAVSPWNVGRVILLVSGNSDSGIIKAAQAVSNSAIRSYVESNVALVSDVRSLPLPNNVPLNRTFADLGYGVRTITDRSSRQTEIKFLVPWGQIPNGDAYVKLFLSHSAMINFERSGATISLNDQPIGSVLFSKETTALSSMQFGLPQSLIHPGVNSFRISADLIRSFDCSNENAQNLWLSIYPESSLHLPLESGSSTVTQGFNLVGFPRFLTTDNELGDVGFVLAKNDPIGWNSAAQIAYVLGNRANGVYVNLAVAYADALTDELKNGRHLVIVGRASQLPILTDLNDSLPAPFAGDSDYANERGLPVEYRVAPGTSVGYLQAMISPWNNYKGVLAILGSDELAIQAATNALINPENRSVLIGNFAVVSGNQLISTQPIGKETSVVPITPATDVTLISQPAVARPAWILPAIVSFAMLLIIVVGVLVGGRLRQKRKNTAT